MGLAVDAWSVVVGRGLVISRVAAASLFRDGSIVYGLLVDLELVLDLKMHYRGLLHGSVVELIARVRRRRFPHAQPIEVARPGIHAQWLHF